MAMLDVTTSSDSSYDRLTRALEWPMGLLALAVIPAILLDDGSETPRVHLLAMSVNWFVWLAFCAEFALKLSVCMPLPIDRLPRGAYLQAATINSVSARSMTMGATIPIAPQSRTDLMYSCFPVGMRARGTQPASAIAPNMYAAV